MASGPVTSWEIDGETVVDFIFWGSKITADGDCSHEIKRCLLLRRKVIINLDSILKSRDITLPTKDPDAGKDWGREEKGTTEDEMVGWHHQLNGHGFGWTPGVGDGQEGLACCSPWGRKELDTTEWLNWTDLKHSIWKEPTFKKSQLEVECYDHKSVSDLVKNPAEAS